MLEVFKNAIARRPWFRRSALVLWGLVLGYLLGGDQVIRSNVTYLLVIWEQAQGPMVPYLALFALLPLLLSLPNQTDPKGPKLTEWLQVRWEQFKARINERSQWMMMWVGFELTLIAGGLLWFWWAEVKIDKLKDYDGLMRGLLTLLPFILGAPFALSIWHWRDRNKVQELENGRLQVRLEDVRELMKLLNDDNPGNQAAAIHLLKNYLLKKSLPEVRQAAWELIRATLASGWEDDIPKAGDELTYEEAQKGMKPLIRAIHQILRKEGRKIFDFKSDFDCRGLNLNYADLSDADFSGLDLEMASLKQTNLIGANLKDANLRFSKLQGAVLRHSELEGADLRHSELEGADLDEADLQNAKLPVSRYNQETQLPENFNPRAHGMIFLNEKGIFDIDRRYSNRQKAQDSPSPDLAPDDK